ncbi:eukaryotic translation initiation factor 4E-binding protein 1-like isoform X2 [Acropora palmata]|uniref:eukaryotic translation initiation factor 4E-binding protein 1-like isoform X2 n=2 Tax=Acropora TaxID=6127 RepID=UPI003D9FC772
MTQPWYNTEHAQPNLVTPGGRFRAKADVVWRVSKIEGVPHFLRRKYFTMNDSETSVLPSESRAIPSRRVVLNDPGQLPIDCSTTPGGTIFSTTPGGTRIIYERKFLLELRNSPLSRTPPQNLPLIPGVTCDKKAKPASPKDNGVPTTHAENDKNEVDQEEPQFEMEI